MTASDPATPDGTPAWRVHSALVLVQFLFGVHYLAAKVVLRDIPPAFWALIRVAGAALLLLLVALLARRAFPRSWRVTGQLALFSIFGVVLNQLCFVEGLSRTTAGHAAILITAIPIATLGLAVALRRERLSGPKILCFVVALVGVLLVLKPGGYELSGATLKGDLLILANALSFSLFLVISRDLMKRVDPLAATALLLTFGSVGMLAFGLPAAEGFDPSSVPRFTWFLGVLIIVFPTALAYLINTWALARAESSRVAFFIYLQPLIATSLSYAIFDEKLDAAVFGGAAMIFGSVYIALRRPGKSV